MTVKLLHVIHLKRLIVRFKEPSKLVPPRTISAGMLSATAGNYARREILLPCGGVLVCCFTKLASTFPHELVFRRKRIPHDNNSSTSASTGGCARDHWTWPLPPCPLTVWRSTRVEREAIGIPLRSARACPPAWCKKCMCARYGNFVCQHLIVDKRFPHSPKKKKG